MLTTAVFELVQRLCCRNW